MNTIYQSLEQIRLTVSAEVQALTKDRQRDRARDLQEVLDHVYDIRHALGVPSFVEQIATQEVSR